MAKSTSLMAVALLAALFAATAVYAFRTGATVSTSEPHTLKLGHSLDQGHPVHAALEFMAERLDEKSSGTLRMEVIPNGQLGAETECVSLVQRGVIAMTKVSAAPLENFVPEMAIFGVPYVFEDEQHYWRVLESDLGRELLLAGEKQGLHGLCYYDAGARSFYTVSKPILEPADLAGLLIRVQESPTSIAMVEALGGSPTPVDFSDLYTNLQQGVLDGAENNPPSFYTNRHYEVCKQYSLDEHTRTPDLLVISQRWWSRLNTQQQQWLAEAAAESAEFERQLWKEKTEEALTKSKEKGVEVYTPDLQAFREQVKPLLESYRGSRVGDLIDRIQKMADDP
ncbi:TRAP transporter substrate-binding protein [Aeoliella mucimassa]|uniref:2,3-diketo-L-gulonate-binding periplasmic protein YiaO n=1 Tax=Aeoliella mucimassa TaxID=2527972 RepID=A0A518AME3_9BACT|nr:TRAP transporter substrate-binding protein [Aeoliella mucimassa]QDU55891.1 2,3-diketo-L-gulonate-binding periplasmic protein YiaO precursor [Aeoliella mucimassa]